MIRLRLLALLAGLAVCGLAGGALAQQAAPTTDQRAPAAKPKAKPKPAKPAPKAAARPASAKPIAASKPAAKPAAKPVAAKSPASAKPAAASTARKPVPAAKNAAPVAVTGSPPKPPAAAAAVAKPELAPPKPAAPPAAATASLGSAQPSRLGQYGDWNAYAANPNGRRVCFALAQPASSQSDPPNRPRDTAYVFVSSRPGEKVANEVSIVIGYAFKPSSEASVEIGPAKFAMYTQNDGAWIKNPAEEGRLIDSMRKGSDMTVKGTSGRGTQTTDTISLKGLAQALDRVAQECR